jgi:hypothetical protein
MWTKAVMVMAELLLEIAGMPCMWAKSHAESYLE